MCGIAGRVNFSSEPVSAALVEAMCDAIAHRGPDDFGVYAKGPAGLGNRRLSIIDLAGGHQPICNEDGTVWIVFNGEIYNFPELRDDLLRRGHQLKSHSDTEVVVHLYEEYGVDCLSRLNGMFAFALWDERRQQLFLARDRVGKKPLMYALTQNAISFGSEIGAILQDASVPREIDLRALDLYLTLLYVPGPWTMFKAIRKLQPGHYLLWRNGQTRIEQYWDVSFAPRANTSEADAVADIRELLEDSVRRRLMSDVPLGAFLSGGLDSSTIVALMTRLTGGPVKTFSIGFDDDAYGELPYAREVAQTYNTEHHEVRVRPDMVDVLPRLVRHYGEPYGDHSAVATYYVSQLARQFVKVVLSGDGGDEVFGGYPWYVEAPRHAELGRAYVRAGAQAMRAGWQSRQLRPMLGAIKGAGLGLWTTAQGWQDPPRAFERLTTYYAPGERRQLYRPEVYAALSANGNGSGLVRSVMSRQNGGQFINQMFYADHHLYLPDDILVKVDIASMANSLEARCPFLDYRLVELAASLPPEMKVRGTATKRILRRAVADLVPENVLNRPKVGFGLPIDRWMREDLYPMARDLLLDSRARITEYFDGAHVETLLTEHKNGQNRHGSRLWLLLFFELWSRTVFEPATTPDQQGHVFP